MCVYLRSNRMSLLTTNEKKFTQRKIDPSMIENSSVAILQIIEARDEIRKHWWVQFQTTRSSPIKSSAYSIDAGPFKEFLKNIFSSSDLLLPNDEDKTLIRSIPPFSLPELEIALKGMANLRSADEEDIVVEMITYANMFFK